MTRQRRRNLGRSVQDTSKQMFMEPFLDLQYASMAAKLRQWQHWQKWTASHSIDSWDPEPVLQHYFSDNHEFAALQQILGRGVPYGVSSRGG